MKYINLKDTKCYYKDILYMISSAGDVHVLYKMHEYWTLDEIHYEMIIRLK